MTNLNYKFYLHSKAHQGVIKDIERDPTAFTTTENDKKLTAIHNEFKDVDIEESADILANAIFEYCMLSAGETNVFVRVKGINHTRYIGFDIKSGKCYDFDPINAQSYRGAKNNEEMEAAANEAKKYYNSCYERVITAPFSVSYVSVDEVKMAESAAFEKLGRQLDGLEE